MAASFRSFTYRLPAPCNSGSGTFGDIRFSGRAVEQNIVRYDGIEGTAIIDSSPGNLNGEVPTPFRLQSSLENVQEWFASTRTAIRPSKHRHRRTN